MIFNEFVVLFAKGGILRMKEKQENANYIEIITGRRREELLTSNIMYITYDRKKTMLHLKNRTILPTSMNLNYFVEKLPAGQFLKANKGVIVALDSIIDLKGEIFTMSDGTLLRGCIRRIGIHKRLLKQYKTRVTPLENNGNSDYKVFDQMPIACCIFEMCFLAEGYEADFICRYVNKAMEHLTGLSKEEMVNKSYSKLSFYEEDEQKWKACYAAAALDGQTQVQEQYSKQLGKKLSIQCYQTVQGYCACLMSE